MEDIGGTSDAEVLGNLYDVQEKKRWTEDDDILLLTQANNERPFVQRKDATRAWQAVAGALLSIDGFTQGRENYLRKWLCRVDNGIECDKAYPHSNDGFKVHVQAVHKLEWPRKGRTLYGTMIPAPPLV
ncbi:hypothetical protein DYB28_004783, partial [Aphanomyces astaci]